MQYLAMDLDDLGSMAVDWCEDIGLVGSDCG